MSRCYKITNDDAKKCVFEGYDYFVYKKILCIENFNTKLKRSYIKTEFTRTYNRKIKKCFLLTF